MSPRRIATIIPFYQVEAGILRRAMLGVMAQRLPEDTTVHVFVINDSSPLPPDADLAGLPTRDGISFSVHTQDNTGPGGARNHGLELTEAGQFDFVAFLDSDDIWHDRHLSDALEALDQGYGFYFCDNARDGLHDSYNNSLPALRNEGEALRSKAELVSPDGPVLGFSPNALSEEMVTHCLCHTSCVVTKADVVRSRRFDVAQRVAGEDHLFWIGISLDGPAIAISWRCNVACGRGVNIFFSAFDWDVPQTLERLGHLLLLNERLKHWPEAMQAGGEHINKAVEEYRWVYSYLFYRTILKGRRPGRDSLRKIRQFDRWLPLRMPLLFLRVALDSKMKRKLS